MIFHLPADCVAPLPHVHDGLTEEYEVIEGTFDVLVEHRWMTLAGIGRLLRLSTDV